MTWTAHHWQENLRVGLTVHFRGYFSPAGRLLLLVALTAKHNGEFVSFYISCSMMPLYFVLPCVPVVRSVFCK